MVTLSTTVPKKDGFTNIWLLAGKVTTGVNSETNGVSFDTPRTTMSNDGYVTIAYRRWGGNPSNYETQLELGSESTPYEPYHEPVTTNIYLDEPLRKIGDYADVIDFERGVAERKINKIVFDGTEDFRAHSTLKGWFQLPDNTVLVGRLACCTHFYYTYSANSMPEGSFTTVNPIGNTGRYVFNMSDETTLDDFKIFLASEYAKGTPVTVYYALAESTTEPISIPSIPTFDGTTIITTDTEIQPSNMEITYKAKKNTEV